MFVSRRSSPGTEGSFIPLMIPSVPQQKYSQALGGAGPLLTRLTRRPGGTFQGTRRDDRPGLEPLETEDFVFELLDAILLGADDLKQLPHQGGIFCFRNLGQSQWHGYILPTAMPFFPIFLRSYKSSIFLDSVRSCAREPSEILPWRSTSSELKPFRVPD